MKKLFAMAFLSVATMAFTGKKPEQPTPEVPTTPTHPSVPAQSIESIVSNSSCSTYGWGNRGKTPKGTLVGIAKVYKAQVCGGVKGSAISSAKDSQGRLLDALALPKYKMEGDTLLHTYAFLIGLSMRESSGRYCEGQDSDAPENRTSNRAEAGLFQTSWDSHSASSELTQIFNEYKNASASKCDLATFKIGATGCTSSDNILYGSGDGRAFQSLIRTCPAFAVAYAAKHVRVGRTHYGPINNGAVELRSDCTEMLRKVSEQKCE